MKKTYRIHVELTLVHEGDYEDDDTPEGEGRATREAKRDTRLNGTVLESWTKVEEMEEKKA